MGARTSPDPTQLAATVRAGDRRALARAITLVESSSPADQVAGDALLDQLSPHAGHALRVGVTGVPGVGKSTFIEALGNHVVDQGLRVAVLAVDPTSAISGGSILGDKTRMETLGRRPEAFIRPSPAGGTLGGVTRHTREAMVVAEAAGFDVVLVETVGVGQSETAVADMTDMFLLLLLPGGGDELQGIKRGIVERADLVVVNKADGATMEAARRAATDYGNALRLLRARSTHWEVPVTTCSALEGTGIAAIWDTILRYRSALTASGELAAHRALQAKAWLWSEMAETVGARLRDDPRVQREALHIEEAVVRGTASPRAAARRLVDMFLHLRTPAS